MAREDPLRTRQVVSCLGSTRSWRVRQLPHCSAGNVDEFEAMEFVLESTDFLAVCLHFRVVAVRGFHHLVNDELGVASNVEMSNSKLDGDLQTVDKGLVLCNIDGCGEMNPDEVPHMDAQG